MWKVTLIRGPKPTISFQHEERRGALRRANALAELHHVAHAEADHEFIIDASERYARAERLKAEYAAKTGGAK
jgi:hypothetical protein